MAAATLLGRTRTMLSRSTRTRREIAEGAKVPFEWLKKFIANAANDYGVRRVQRLHDFLEADEEQQRTGAAATPPATPIEVQTAPPGA